MRRSQFLDMSSKLAVASRGNLGDDKERKQLISGRLLYNTILKYMVERLGLTPRVRLAIQRITPWDPELAAACMEQSALKASDMPTVTYVATGWTPTLSTFCRKKSKRCCQTS
jgi:hypothetical protein